MSNVKVIHVNTDKEIRLEVRDGDLIQFQFGPNVTKKVLIAVQPDSKPIASGLLPAPAVMPDGTIEGHPNCQVGECIDCHVVSCDIYQGYRAMP